MDITGGGGGSVTIPPRNVRVLHAADYPYAVLPTDDVLLLDAAFTPVKLLLPSYVIAPVGKRLTLHRLDQNPPATEIEAAGGETIDGFPSVAIPAVGTWSCDLECIGDDQTGFVKGWSFVNGSAAGMLRLQAGPTVAPIQASIAKLGTYVKPFQPYVAGFYAVTTRTYNNVAAPDQLQSYDTVTLYDTNGGALAANLNGASGLGQFHWVKNIGTSGNPVVFTAIGGALVDGLPTLTLLDGQAASLITDGVNWHTLGKSFAAVAAFAGPLNTVPQLRAAMISLRAKLVAMGILF